MSLYNFSFDYCSGNTFNGKTITSKNILQLSPQIPRHLKQNAERFFLKNPGIADLVSGDDAPLIISDHYLKMLYKRDRAMSIENAGIKSLSATNLIFELPTDTRYLVRASGYSNKRENINRWLRDSCGFASQVYGASLPPALLQLFNEEYGKTYQTISQMAYWLRINNFINHKNLQYIKIPMMYLFHLPNKPIDICDHNYIILSQKIPLNTIPLSQSPLAHDAKIIKELAELTAYSALWDIKVDANVFTDGIFIYCFDLEQPSVHSPADFFLKNNAIYQDDVLHGLKRLRTIIQAYDKKNKAQQAKMLKIVDAVEEDVRKRWENCRGRM